MSGKILSLNINAAFGGFAIDINETLRLDGVTALFGPSGAGKSSLLRAIAGFDNPKSGYITFDGAKWFDRAGNVRIPPHKRNIGFLFQDARLFPHLTVAGNLDYAARRSNQREDRYTVDEVVTACDIQSLLERRPDRLSGGEQQRAALARTLLTRPDLLLFDEPLSALDRLRKREILPYLRAIPKKFDVPAIYVSHNINEITQIADHALIMRDGRIIARGPFAETLNAIGIDDGVDPNDAGTTLQGVVDEHDTAREVTIIRIGDDTLRASMNTKLALGDHIRLRVKERDVAIALSPPSGISIRNIIPARISKVASDHNAPFVRIALDLSGGTLSAKITKDAAADLELRTGQNVYALIKAVSFDL